MHALTTAFQISVSTLFLLVTIAYGYAKGVSVYDSFVALQGRHRNYHGDLSLCPGHFYHGEDL